MVIVTLAGLGVGFVILVASVLALYLLPAYPGPLVLTFAVFPLLLIPVLILAVPESPLWLEGKGRVEQADAIVTRLEDSARRRGNVLATPNFDRYAVPERERVPVGEVFKGQYLERTVVLLAVWLLLYVGIDYGFNSYSGVYVVDNGWSAHDLFVMILIGGSFGIVGLAVNSFISERIERKISIAAAGVLMCVGAIVFCYFPHSFAWLTTATAITNLYNHPGFMLLFLGMKQKRAVLEVISK